jgi:small subunit ribosomal protein S6
MFLLDIGKMSRDWNKATKQVQELLERHGAEVLVTRPWDERPLAYPIKRQRRGMYLLSYFRTDGSKIAEIERDCRLNEGILRQLILKVDPKLVEQLVAQAMATPEAEEEEVEEAVYADAVEADELIEEVDEEEFEEE